MQYKVPQNVDIEDKVIGGLTLRQFMFLMVAGGIILIDRYLLKALHLDALFLPSVILIGGAGIALAFFKVNDRPLEVFIISAAKSILRPTKRIWQKEVLMTKLPETPKQQTQTIKKKEDVENIKSNLQRLAMIVDSGGAPDQQRITNIKPRENDEPRGLNDVLSATEKPENKLSELLDDAKKLVEKKKPEKPISALASVPPQEGQQIKYNKVNITDRSEVDELLEAVEEKTSEKKEGQ
jgi:hypothetical protein